MPGRHQPPVTRMPQILSCLRCPTHTGSTCPGPELPPRTLFPPLYHSGWWRVGLRAGLNMFKHLTLVFSACTRLATASPFVAWLRGSSLCWERPLLPCCGGHKALLRMVIWGGILTTWQSQVPGITYWCGLARHAARRDGHLGRPIPPTCCRYLCWSGMTHPLDMPLTTDYKERLDNWLRQGT